MEELKQVVKEAILDSIRRRGAATCPKGYALIVDGDLQAVLGACLSQESFEEEGEEVLFMPVDWDEESHTPAFERASVLLGQSPGEDYESRAKTAVDALTVALEDARGEVSELRGSFLLVASVSGGKFWQRLEGESVRRLNSPELFERWKAEQG